MADDTDVKQLLLAVDATTELLRRNLAKADSAVAASTANWQKQLDQSDKGFARVGQGLDNLAPAIARTNAQISTIGVSVIRAQKQVEASASVMKTSLQAAASSLAIAFSADKVRDYADGYTRFTNQLKVAGLEGGNLAIVQQALFSTAQKYGAPLEAIGTLYGRAAQTGKALGASQADLLRFSNAVAAALKVQGGSAEESAGALLQLSQALGSGTVHAEEFNSVNEGLRPLLQAVADASDRYRGNVALLKNDVNAQKLSSQELFQLILKGYDQLDARASRAGFTIGASFTILNNAIGQYIGGTDSSLSATERFSQAIQLLAQNLDTVAPALETIAVTFGVLKAGGIAIDLVSGALAKVADADRATARAVLLGNAQFIDRAALVARVAIAEQEAAAAEVAAIEETVAARRADIAALEENLALIRSQRAEALQAQAAIAESSAIGFGRIGQGRGVDDAARQTQDHRSELVTKRAITVADRELTAAELALAGAQARSTAATEAATAATAATTVGARAAAGASALFAGALDLIAGALPVIAVAAVVAAIIHFREEVSETRRELADFDTRNQTLRAHIAELDSVARAASGSIARIGQSAATAGGQMRSFAGQVGEAAQRLYDLAAARRLDQVTAFEQDKYAQLRSAREAQDRINSRRVSAKGETYSTDAQADEDDRRRIAEATRNAENAHQLALAAARLPLESRLSESERNGGRDVAGDLSRARNDLRVAQAGGDKTEINRLKAQVYELTQYQAYRKAGSSDESASARAKQDAERLQQAGQAKIDRDAGAKADRETVAGKRRQASQVVDAANDERAYQSAVRAAQDKIATANADLSNSAAARAQIERDRIRAEQASRDREIEDQAKAGHLGTPEVAAKRVTELQALNKTAADRQVDVIDLHERQQQEKDALDLSLRKVDFQRDQLSGEEQLATTAAQRRAIELHLLDLEKQEEKLRLERVLAFDSGASDGERQQALLDYSTLDARYATKGAVVATQTEGPLAGYRRQLQSSVGNLHADAENLEVSAIDHLGSSLETAAQKALKLHGLLGSLAADLLKLVIQREIELPIANALTGGGGGGGGFLSALGGLFGGRRALGGGVQAGKVYWVGENGPEPFIPGADGSIVPNHALRQPGAPVFQPAAPKMADVGAARRAAMPPVVISVEEGALFRPVVHGIAASHVNEAAPRIAAGGAQLAGINQQRAQRRRLA